MPILRLAFRKAEEDNFVSSVPLRTTLPEVGCTRRFTHLIKVDFPAPDGPIRAKTWPLGISNVTPLRASSPVLYFFVNSVSCSIWYLYVYLY